MGQRSSDSTEKDISCNFRNLHQSVTAELEKQEKQNGKLANEQKTMKASVEDIEKQIETQRKKGKGLGNMGLEQTKAQIAVQAARDALADAEHRLKEAKKKLMEGDDSFGVTELENAVDEAEKAVQQAQAIWEEAAAHESEFDQEAHAAAWQQAEAQAHLQECKDELMRLQDAARAAHARGHGVGQRAALPAAAAVRWVGVEVRARPSAHGEPVSARVLARAL